MTIQERKQTQTLIEKAVLDGYCQEKVGMEAIKALNRRAWATLSPGTQKAFVRNLPPRGVHNER